MYNLDEVEEKIVQWSGDRGILKNGKAITQCLKLMSELGELADNLAKGNSTKDDIGDCFVVLTNIARLEGTTLVECANEAYEDIKDRKGFLNANGNFIKSTDANYDKLLAEFNDVVEPLCVRVETSAFDDFSDHLKPTWEVLFDDGTEEIVTFTPVFQKAYPEGPLGLPKKLIMENN